MAETRSLKAGLARSLAPCRLRAVFSLFLGAFCLFGLGSASANAESAAFRIFNGSTKTLVLVARDSHHPPGTVTTGSWNNGKAPPLELSPQQIAEISTTKPNHPPFIPIFVRITYQVKGDPGSYISISYPAPPRRYRDDVEFFSLSYSGQLDLALTESGVDGANASARAGLHISEHKQSFWAQSPQTYRLSLFH